MAEEKKIDIKCLGEKNSSKNFGLGIRHLQMFCMCINVLVLYQGRSNLSVAILAMTDVTRSNDTNVEIYDWDKNTQGLILSSFFWGYAIMQIPAGVLAKKYGGKFILFVALVANGILCIALPTLAHYGGWICVCICRVFMGLTQACLFPASHTLMGQWLPASERTALSALTYGGGTIGTIIAMPISGILAETALGWKMIFYSTAGLMLFAALIWFWFAANSPGEHRMITEEEKKYIECELQIGDRSKQNQSIPWADLLRSCPLWAILVVHVAAGVALTLYLVDLPTYLEKAMQISLKNSASLSALPHIGMWIGSIFSSAICEQIYNRRILSMVACRKLFTTFSLLGTATGCITLAFLTPEQKQLAVVMLVATLTMLGFMSAGFMVNHLDLSPNLGGVMISITNFAAAGGGAFTPVITSFILKNDPSNVDQWRVVFLLVGILSVATNVLYVVFGRADRQPWDTPEGRGRQGIHTIEEMEPLKNLKELERIMEKSQKSTTAH